MNLVRFILQLKVRQKVFVHMRCLHFIPAWLYMWVWSVYMYHNACVFHHVVHPLAVGGTEYVAVIMTAALGRLSQRGCET